MYSPSLTSLFLLNLSLTGRSLAALHPQWPSLHKEELESLIWDNEVLEGFTRDCRTRDNSTVAAQWVRMAYHDMSTHNVDDGTGGLDASIVFELDRPQNIGQGMLSSFGDFLTFGPVISLADNIAAGTIIGTVSCGGPLIPFRGGRKDVTSAGPATVPEPQQDLASHTESFRRQGFTQSEMIALVACGHTFGGVRGTDFPDIVHDRPATDMMLFDGTDAFDNTVVTGYLEGTTPNPLVVGPNTTTNSDLRIFSSDGNATMQSLASPETFGTICANLFERMINTVPSDVQLTEVIEPMQYKVLQSLLFPGIGDGFLRFVTRLRVLDNRFPSQTVTLFYSDRQESVPGCPSTGCSSAPKQSITKDRFMLSKRGINGYTIYDFDVSVNATSSISKFWFRVDRGDGSEPVLVDNDGARLLVEQDTLLYDPSRSRTKLVPNSDPSKPPRWVTNIVVAFKTDGASSVPSISFTTWEPHTDAEPTTPVRTTVPMTVDPLFPPQLGYIFYSGDTRPSGPWLELVAQVEGGTIKEGPMQALQMQ
ncbi:hypothetical protein PM082_021654 [Marasmius tenuissimus]|nr:hypothetical protein PM082_021654 [Marasmius tenuissimus]